LRRLIAALLAAALGTLAPPGMAASALCGHHPAAHAALERLEDAMAHGRFIAYAPTSLQVIDGQSTVADPASIAADLAALRPRFDSLVTYRADQGTQAIAEAAQAQGFRALIIGVWNPYDPAELEAALTSARAHPRLVVGLSLGNEMVLGARASFEGLATLMQQVRARMPGLLLSTSEPFHLFYQPAAAPTLAQADFLLANVHPVFQPWFKGSSDADDAQFVVNVTGDLKAHYCGPVLVKETGIPTEPAEQGYTSARQADFYAELARRFPPSRRAAFAYFSAFDLPWRATDPILGPGVHTSEAHWGLYDAHREPKPAVSQVPKLR
jgi:exo-beta-1,3-glucanase (GH17 family)